MSDVFTCDVTKGKLLLLYKTMLACKIHKQLHTTIGNVK